ncbi:extracellular solute-binding protein [Haloactinopolyspora sp.]|uniref:ABC transporter substrate-binding protein n=1 Tax=Haloactinopolyspora sp. TaxID=1966353 RepID=UPI002604A99A|nr:extracellular solute-binding protein [Haloactinopolyspora sp.]
MFGTHNALSRRRFLTASAGLGAAALIGGCSNDTAADAGADGEVGGELTVWTWADLFEETFKIFEEKNPGTTVNVEIFAGDEYATKLLSSLSAGAGPDVAMIEITNVANFKGKPGFVDLAAEPYDAGQFADQYADFGWGYVLDDEGKVFALPKNTGPAGMFYRRDIFEEVGLPTEPDQVNEAFKTWDDFLAEGAKVAIPDERWLVDTPMAIVQAIIGQGGLSYFNEAGEPQLNTPEMAEAVEYAKRAHDAGLISPFEIWSQEWGATVQNGTVAAYLIGNWFGGNVKNLYGPDTAGLWGVTFPPASGGTSAFNSGGDFIGILETSQNKATAWEFIKFVTQDTDSLRPMYQEIDLYPAWQPALEEDWMNQPDDFYAGQNVNEVFAAVSEEMKPPITNENDVDARDTLTDAVNEVLRKGTDIQSALDAVQERVAGRAG